MGRGPGIPDVAWPPGCVVQYGGGVEIGTGTDFPLLGFAGSGRVESPTSILADSSGLSSVAEATAGEYTGLEDRAGQASQRCRGIVAS